MDRTNAQSLETHTPSSQPAAKPAPAAELGRSATEGERLAFFFATAEDLLPVLLTGCGATLPTCEPVSQPLPAPPSISTPLPQVSYSLTAAESLQTWRQKLTVMLPTSD